MKICCQSIVTATGLKSTKHIDSQGAEYVLLDMHLGGNIWIIMSTCLQRQKVGEKSSPRNHGDCLPGLHLDVWSEHMALQSPKPVSRWWWWLWWRNKWWWWLRWWWRCLINMHFPHLHHHHMPKMKVILVMITLLKVGIFCFFHVWMCMLLNMSKLRFSNVSNHLYMRSIKQYRLSKPIQCPLIK